METRSQEVGDSLVLVLSSGGVDSTTALALALEEGLQVETLFVDYGQAAALAESEASAAVAAYFGVNRRAIQLSGLSFSDGEIRARNAFLLHTALLAFPRATGRIILGIHAGTPYRDCSSAFVKEMQRSFDFHVGGAITIAAPFLEAEKGGIWDLARDLGVPLPLTFSCESGNQACGRCLSCLDRKDLVARA